MAKQSKIAVIPFDDLVAELDRRDTKLLKKILEVQSSKEPSKTKGNLVPTKKLSEILGITRQTILNYRKAGLINSYSLGGKVFFDLDQIIDKLKSGRLR